MLLLRTIIGASALGRHGLGERNVKPSTQRRGINEFDQEGKAIQTPRQKEGTYKDWKLKEEGNAPKRGNPQENDHGTGSHETRIMPPFSQAVSPVIHKVLTG